jgi:hypothetical protein
MLKWSFLILLLANALLYGWFYQEQQYRREVANRAENRVHGLAELDLLSEVPASALRLREPEPRPEPIAALDVETERLLNCYRFGVFAQAQGLEAWLGQEAPGELELEQEVSAELPSVYGVSISAPRGAQAQEELLGTMRSVGLEGEWSETSEGRKELSLGAYEALGSAQALELALQQQGYAAVVKEQKRYRYNYYLLLRTNSEVVANSAWAQSLLKKFPAVKSEKKLCQRVATAQGRE